MESISVFMAISNLINEEKSVHLTLWMP